MVALPTRASAAAHPARWTAFNTRHGAVCGHRGSASSRGLMLGEHASASLVATLISASPRGRDVRAIERPQRALPAANAPVWLAPGIAADIPFSAPAAG